MATAISKLRKDFYNEQKAKNEMMKDVIIERKMISGGGGVSSTLKKMVIDPEKLERTIQKACQPVQKKCITFLEKPPVPSEKVLQKNPVPVVLICQARNLNGTPCKCKAKIGKFCAKHVP